MRRAWIVATTTLLITGVVGTVEVTASSAPAVMAPGVDRGEPSVVERQASPEGRRTARAAAAFNARADQMARAALAEQSSLRMQAPQAQKRIAPGRKPRGKRVLPPSGGSTWKGFPSTTTPPPPQAPAQGGGNYAATPFTTSAQWSQGGSSGSFSWSYPFTAPTPSAGPAPALGISYDSGSVDGRTSVSNNQSSVIGDGFELTSSYIERRYTPCANDGAAEAKQDLCWRGEQLNLVLNGSASELVQVGPDSFISRSDDGTKVERLTGADNGDNNGEHWRVTTAEGVRYVFGKNKLPDAQASSPVTESVWTAPVFKIGTTSNDPAQADECAATQCKEAWRWNLDLVQDLHGNVATYWYQAETNHYRRGGDTPVAYERGGRLVAVDYGLRAGALFNAQGERTTPSHRMVLSYDERCLAAECGTLTETNKAKWPDVPFDSVCAAGEACTDQKAPTFFTRKRLTKVTSQSRSAGVLTDVDSWEMDHLWYDPGNVGDGTDQVLFPKSIKRTALAGPTPIAFRKVELAPTLDESMANRVDATGDGITPLERPRLKQIVSETGAVTRVTYAPVECTPANKPAGTKEAIAANTKRCFPVYWAPYGGDERLDWFHKYVVEAVTVEDTTTGDRVMTSYDYLGGAAWRFNDDHLLANKHRTWSSWRGYGRVATLVGPGDKPQTKSVTAYYRGMHGDRTAGGGTATAQAPAITAPDVLDRDEFAGSAREQVVYNGENGAEISGTVTTLTSSGTQSQTLPGGPVDGDPADAVELRAKRVATETGVSRVRVTSGSSPTHSSVTTDVKEFNADGYPTLIETSARESTGAAPSTQTCTRIWHARNPAINLLGQVVRSRTVKGSCAQEPALADYPALGAGRGSVLSDVSTLYDGASAWSGQTPDRALVTGSQRSVGYGSADGSSPSWQRVSSQTYDALGRPLVTKDALARAVATTSYVPSGGGPLEQMTVANGLGHQTETTYEPLRGLATTTKNADSWVDEMAYDAAGRLTSVWTGLDRTIDGDTPTFKYEYHLGGAADSNGFVQPSWIATSEKDKSGNGYLTTYEISDALLRVRQTQSKSQAGGRLLTDTEYDEWGRIARTFTDVWDPDAQPSGAWFRTSAGGFVQTDFSYDGAGRKLSETVSYTHPDPDQSGNTRRSFTTALEYAGNTTTQLPPEGGLASRTTTDALGRQTKLESFAGRTATGTPLVTAYSYDAEGLLTKVTGADGSEWSYGYDLNDRKVTADDPDTGLTETDYDELDQVVAVTNSLDQALRYDYDVLGRKTKQYEGAATPANLTAEWTYDSVLKGEPTASIRYVGGATGAAYKREVLAYDRHRLPIRTQVVLPADDPLVSGPQPTGTTPHPAAVSQALEFRTTRNANDATVTSVRTPKVPGLAQETRTITYDDFRSPIQMVGIVSGTSYDAFGDVVQTELSQSVGGTQRVWLTNGYDGLRRPQWFRADDTSSNTALINLDYQYDPSGKITRIRDNAPNQSSPDNQCFAYGDWNRLSHAWTSKSGQCDAATRTLSNIDGAAPYWHSYTYNDASGTRATSTQHYPPASPVGGKNGAVTTYAYGGACDGGAAGPHALTSVAVNGVAQAHCVNARGDATHWWSPAGARTDLTWNAEGKVAKTVQGSTTTSYLYDADGALLIKRPGADPTGSSTDGVTTLYLGDLEVQVTKAGSTYSAKSLRYYQYNGQQVAVRTGTSASSTSTVTLTAGDHHGTANATWKATAVAERTKRHSDPFGRSRDTTAPTWVDDKGFLGKPHDAETGLTYIGARMYDPRYGRFISVDPLLDTSDANSMNGYTYGNNDPVNLSDPTGLNVTDGKVGGSGPSPSDDELAVVSTLAQLNTQFSGLNPPESSSSDGSDSGGWKLSMPMIRAEMSTKIVEGARSFSSAVADIEFTESQVYKDIAGGVLDGGAALIDSVNRLCTANRSNCATPYAAKAADKIGARDGAMRTIASFWTVLIPYGGAVAAPLRASRLALGAAKGAARGGPAAKIGTVWDDVVGTASAIPGTGGGRSPLS